LIFSLWLSLIGGIIVVGGLYGWIMEPPDDPDLAHDDHGPDAHASDGGDAAVAEPSEAVKEVETVG
jgi:hypothetical protein